jgi:hypothetical protein
MLLLNGLISQLFLANCVLGRLNVPAVHTSGTRFIHTTHWCRYSGRFSRDQYSKLYRTYLNAVVLIRSVEKLELTPMLTFDSTIRTTLVSCCNLRGITQP